MALSAYLKGALREWGYKPLLSLLQVSKCSVSEPKLIILSIEKKHSRSWWSLWFIQLLIISSGDAEMRSYIIGLRSPTCFTWMQE